MNVDELVNLSAPYTGMHTDGLRKLHKLASDNVAVPGAVVQCGTSSGGSAVVLWHACGADDNLWMFDSFEGLPPPTDEDGGRAGSKYAYKMEVFGSWCKGSRERAVEIARLAGVPKRKTHIVKGWFADTLPEWADKIGPIALLHLDADWYKSTLECLQWLYPHLVTGGLLVLDDYGHWQGTDQACRDYGIDALLTKTPPCGAYMTKGLEVHREQ